ncbi:Rad1/Rec1/Rad17 [Terfezia claveryi]|nr:Rad1/Rec1/Rad17 [Terfezia claveryi]
MNTSQETPNSPCFSAVTSSARQLFNILRCVGFVSRAQVQISSDGIRVSVEDSRVMQGHAFLDSKLFTTFTFHLPPPSPQQQPESQPDEDPDTTVTFNISLSALLECLQLFSADSAHQKSNSNYNSFYAGSISAGGERGGGGGPGGIFDQNALRITGTCKLVYGGMGAPLCVV